MTFLLVWRSLFISFYSLIIPLSLEIPKSEVVAVLNILPMGNKYNKFIAHYFIAKSVSCTNIYFCRDNKTPCVLQSLPFLIESYISLKTSNAKIYLYITSYLKIAVWISWHFPRLIFYLKNINLFTNNKHNYPQDTCLVIWYITIVTKSVNRF